MRLLVEISDSYKIFKKENLNLNKIMKETFEIYDESYIRENSLVFEDTSLQYLLFKNDFYPIDFKSVAIKLAN